MLTEMKDNELICKHCAGAGLTKSHIDIGKHLSRRRVAVGLQGKMMAAKIGVSPSYLSDLENGRRDWSPRLIRMYLAAL